MQTNGSTRPRSTKGEPAAVRAAGSARSRRKVLAQRGQVLALLAMSIFVLIGFVAIVIDISWYWSNSLRVQRAADAAALAGAVDLPTNPGSAGVLTLGTGIGDALKEAAKNGYTNGIGGVAVTPVPDNVAKAGGNANQMDVTISAPVSTFFMRAFGITTITATRSSKALYTLPVPMGSPENYYGVFGAVRDETFFMGPSAATTAPTDQWASSPTTATPRVSDLTTSDNQYASASAAAKIETLGGFGFSGFPSGSSVVGITVSVDGSGNKASGCAVKVDLSWNNGASWTTGGGTGVKTQALTTTDPATPYKLPVTDTDTWGRTWATGELANGSFLARLTPVLGGSCTLVKLDQVKVKVIYAYNNSLTGPGASCPNGAANCYQDTGGQTLNARGFWATMNTEGAANVNGDAYQPFYDTPTSGSAKTCPSAGNACYDPLNFYNYAVSMPPNTTGGYVYVYDPVFCATALASGTGDRWFGGSTGISSWYELFNTNNTPYTLADDTLVTGATSGSLFRDIAASDSTMGGSGGSECGRTDTRYNDGRDYHDSWYLLNPGNPLTGGPNGTVYRLHTTSSVPPGQTDSVDQKNANGEQSFAIFAKNAEGTTANGRLPQVYGLGAMQMFTPLSASGTTVNSEFYLAQVPAYYAGKTLELHLWDPGDTKPLAATLYIEVPTASGWSITPFTYSAAVGTTGGANSACNSNSNSSTSNNSVQTNVGNTTGLFNGCWLTMEVPIPTGYAADQSGWWKIRYSMTGDGTSSDVTTWTAQILGNPVHLVVP